MSVHSKVIDTDFVVVVVVAVVCVCVCVEASRRITGKKRQKKKIKGRQPWDRRQLLQSHDQELTQLPVYTVNPFNHVFKWHGYSVPIVARPL